MEALLEFLRQKRDETPWRQVVQAAWGAPAAPDGEADRRFPEYHPVLARGQLLAAYRAMYLSRRLDDREIVLQKQGKAWFSISGAGKEAVLTAAGMILRKTDPILGYYRDRALALVRGLTPLDMLLQCVAAADDPASGGRMMPAHYSRLDLALIIQPSPVGAQTLPASGLAEALLKSRLLGDQTKFPPDSVVYTDLGDGTVAEGEVYEAIMNAALWKAPLLIHVMDDGYGISVPVAEQRPGGDPARIFSATPNLRIVRVDGTDFRASWDALTDGIAHARAHRGPVLVHSQVVRLRSHSSTDDQRKYRPSVEVSTEVERDPIERFARELVAFGIATPDELLAISEEVDREIDKAVDEALARPKTDTTTLLSNVILRDPKATDRAYAARFGGRKSAHAGEARTLADALNAALGELLEADPRIIMWGEDIADFSQGTFPQGADLEGKGGVFGITKGLQRRFGPERVFNSPIAEATIVGKAIGYAHLGFLPVVEVQFRDYLNPAWQQLVDQAATLLWRSNGAFSCPMVIRMAYGGYLGGAGALWHSESAVGPLLHYPGLCVAVASNARDAVGLLREAAYCGNVVLFCEPKALYRRKDEFLDQPYPDFDYRIPMGRCRRYGDGADLAILAYGNAAPLGFRLWREMDKEGVRARFLDLLWLSPLDEEEIRRAAAECGRVLIVEEDRRRSGAGSAVADVIYRDRQLRRKVDVERIAALDCRVSYGPVGEQAVLPQYPDILATARALLSR